jgi:hypothetical protein
MPIVDTSDHRLLAYRQRLVIFLVVVFMFAVVSIRTEIQQDAITSQQRTIASQSHQLSVTNARLADTQYHECLIRNESARNLNKILDAIIVAVKTTPGLSAAERTKRVALYSSAKSSIFDCGKDPAKP